MRNRKIIYGILFGLLVVSLVMAGMIAHAQDQTLRVDFLDVGQGDAILISQGNKQILIDGGPGGQVLMEKLGKYIPFWDRDIEMIIATHPDADHIAGLVDAVKNYRVGELIQTEAQSDSQIFRKLQEIIQEKNIPVIGGERGVDIKLGDGVQMDILDPGGSSDWNKDDTNASSIVARLIFGNNSFLFTGDLPSVQETELIANKAEVKADVLKIGHHGSKYSTSAEFLDAVSPKDAVISVGKNNRYSHPAMEVLDMLKSKSIKILRTDEMGDIRYECPSLSADCVLVAN